MTTIEARSLLLRIVKSLQLDIDGGYYTAFEGSSNRPVNSQFNDCVVSIITGDTNADQHFIGVINVFFKDKEDVNGVMQADGFNIKPMEKLFFEELSDFSSEIEYEGNKCLVTIELDGSIKVISIDESKQHCLSSRVNLIIDNFNK